MNKRQIAIGGVLLFLMILGGGVGVLYYHAQTVTTDALNRLKESVTKDFHDPESARFRSVELQSLEGSISQRVKGINLSFLMKASLSEIASTFTYDPKLFNLCGEVNAKNGFGAYVGYRGFFISADDGATPLIGDTKELCGINDFAIVSEP